MASKAQSTRKAAVISELEAGFKQSPGIYIADFSRVTVETVTGLRSSLRKKGIRMKVAKNTLIKRALDNAGIKGLDSTWSGPTAVILADDQDPMAPAKALVEFHKANEGMLPVKVRPHRRRRLSGQPARRPGQDARQAGTAGRAWFPWRSARAQKIAGIIKGPGANIAGQIKAQIEKLEGGAK